MRTIFVALACLAVGALVGHVSALAEPTVAAAQDVKVELREDQIAAILAWVRAHAKPAPDGNQPMEMQVNRSTPGVLVSGVVSGPTPGLKTAGAWLVLAGENGGAPIVLPYPPSAPAQDHLPKEEELATLDAPKLLQLYQLVRRENMLLRELNQAQKDMLSDIHKVFIPRKKVEKAAP